MKNAYLKKAYLLIDVDISTKPEQVARLLRKKPSISYADAVTGPHDVIAVLEGWDKGGHSSKALNEVKEIAGVRYITTCFTIRAESGNGT